MRNIRVDTYNHLGTPTPFNIRVHDGYAVLDLERDVLFMSATELDELAQAAAHAAQMVRRGDEADDIDTLAEDVQGELDSLT